MATAIDTNVIVRFLVVDDIKAARRAHELITRERILLTVSVIMETEWVLRGSYGYSRAEILEGLEKFLGTGQVVMTEPAVISDALHWYRAGLDFADAVHLASAREADRMVTFDQRFAKSAGRLGDCIPVSVL